jgi:polyisoprenoid-binding protein YceI
MTAHLPFARIRPALAFDSRSWPFRRFLQLLVPAVMLGGGVRASESPLVIDKANSRIEIAVTATVDSFVATLADYAPALVYDSAANQVTSAKIGFHFEDIKTGREKRDREMNAWQQSDKFPEGAFALAMLGPAADGRLEARGTLALHGVTHSLAFPAVVKRNGPAVTIDGDATVDTRNFGLAVIRKYGLLKVDPVVVVHFHLTGVITVP